MITTRPQSEFDDYAFIVVLRHVDTGKEIIRTQYVLEDDIELAKAQAKCWQNWPSAWEVVEAEAA